MEFYNIDKVLAMCDENLFKPVEDLIPPNKLIKHDKLLKKTLAYLIGEVNKVIAQ